MSWQPAVVTGLDNVAKISVGWYHNIVQREDGTYWGWGWNDANRLGLGQSWYFNTATELTDLADATVVLGHARSSFAIIDGELFGWGSNHYGVVDLDNDAIAVNERVSISIP